MLGCGHTELVNSIKEQGLGTCLGLCIHLDMTLRRSDSFCGGRDKQCQIIATKKGLWLMESQTGKANPDSHGGGCLFPGLLTDVRKREHGWFLLQGNGR